MSQNYFGEIRGGQRACYGAARLILGKRNDLNLNRDVARLIAKSVIETANCAEWVPNFAEFKLPDGRTISIGSALIEVAEPIFNPSLLGFDSNGLPWSVMMTLQKIDISIRREFSSNIILGGGNTNFPGFEKRLISELANENAEIHWKIAQEKKRIYSINPHAQNICGLQGKKEINNRAYSAWRGGSILASLSSFQKMWISKSEYLESGSAVFEQRGF